MINVALRNYFAGKVIQGLLANPNGPVVRHLDGNWSISSTYEDVASEAFEMADAMMGVSEIDFSASDTTNTESDWEPYLFLGGPKHKTIFSVPRGSQMVEVDEGSYYRHVLHLGNGASRIVYVWSEVKSDEAVDLLLSAIGLPPYEGTDNIDVSRHGDGIKVKIVSGGEIGAFRLPPDKVEELVGVLHAFLRKHEKNG